MTALQFVWAVSDALAIVFALLMLFACCGAKFLQWLEDRRRWRKAGLLPPRGATKWVSRS